MKPGIATTEFSLAGLGGGAIYELVMANPNPSIGGAIVMGSAILGIAALGVVYTMYRTKAKNGGA